MASGFSADPASLTTASLLPIIIIRMFVIMTLAGVIATLRTTGLTPRRHAFSA
jgi:hypothetical protein